MENTTQNRRRYKRYAVSDDAIVACNSRIGRITNISEGGMAVNFITNEPFLEGHEVTILCRTKNLHIKNLPIRLVRKKDDFFSSVNGYQVLPVGIEFNYSNAVQQEEIRTYISKLS